MIDNESSMERRIKTFRKAFNIEEPLEEFDRAIFDSLVDKVIIGDVDEDENDNPYVVTFVLNSGKIIRKFTYIKLT